jgi:hypothetical protein
VRRIAPHAAGGASARGVPARRGSLSGGSLVRRPMQRAFARRMCSGWTALELVGRDPHCHVPAVPRAARRDRRREQQRELEHGQREGARRKTAANGRHQGVIDIVPRKLRRAQAFTGSVKVGCAVRFPDRRIIPVFLASHPVPRAPHQPDCRIRTHKKAVAAVVYRSRFPSKIQGSSAVIQKSEQVPP